LKTAWGQGFLAFYTEGVMEALKLFSFTTTAKNGRENSILKNILPIKEKCLTLHNSKNELKLN
jgi:hypothetical protein